MRKKLTISAFAIATIILLIISGNQVIINLFGSFSEKLITEYHELHVLQELKISLSKTIIYVNSQHENADNNSEENLRLSLEDSQLMFENCSKILTSVHRGDSWNRIESLMTELSVHIDRIIKEGIVSDNTFYEQSYLVINNIIEEIDLLVSETLEEIQEYEVRNSKVILHGTFTVIAFGVILILFLIIGGMRFIKNLTNPIFQLVKATQKISKGKRNLKVDVDSDDEFKILADSFNSMLDALNKTTISEKYLRNILDSLYGALLVTDNNCNIRSLNRTTSKLLGYGENELLEQNIMLLFERDFHSRKKNDENSIDLKKISKKLRKKTGIITKKGRTIPVYVTCTILNNHEGMSEGMVVVGHDLTEEKEQEKKIEKIRKEGVIAINEAQENERLRIASDIHDGLGQMLTGISYTIQDLEPGQDSETSLLQKLQKQVNSTIQETKNIAHDLTPIMIKDFGLVAAIQNLVDRTNLLNEIEVIFNAYDFDERIDSKLEKGIYRITQEALNNIQKHAKAKSATIQLLRDANQIVLVVEDDGVGFEIKDPLQKDIVSGIGLISMRERVNAFDGVLTMESQLGKGTEIIAEFPCRKRENENN